LGRCYIHRSRGVSRVCLVMSLTYLLVYVGPRYNIWASNPIPTGRSLCTVKNKGGGIFQHLVSYFSGNSLKFMPPDVLILAQNALKMRLAGGARPDPLGELTALPRPPSWIEGVQNAPNFVPRFGGIEAHGYKNIL